MTTKTEVLAAELAELRDNLKGLATAAVTDPKEQKRKERKWALLYGGLSAVFTLATRRLAARAWTVLTGEKPPAKK